MSFRGAAGANAVGPPDASAVEGRHSTGSQANADAAITVNPVVKFVDKATQSINATKQAIAFHELVEAYHRVDKNMPYGDFDTYGAHFAAKEPERIMRMQRPSWTTHPAGGCATQK